MTSSRNKISPSGLFVLLYISRLIVTLTALSPQNFGDVSGDLLISLLISLGLTLVFSLPVIFCLRKKKNPIETRWLGVLYSLYFIFIASVNVSKFSYFASTTLSPETRAWVFIAIVGVCAFYCTTLGIEALTRFSAFAFVMIIVGIAVVVLFNLHNFKEVNLYPVVTNSVGSIVENIALITSNTTELALFLCLRKRVNGGCEKSFAVAVISAFFSIFILILFMIAVMGDGASLQSFPLYTFFQITKFDRFQRLDVFHISFWILGIFIKTVLLQYCASISINGKNKKLTSAVISVIVAAASFIMLQMGITEKTNPVIIIIPFCIFSVLIPILSLIFKKKNSGDELLEEL